MISKIRSAARERIRENSQPVKAGIVFATKLVFVGLQFVLTIILTRSLEKESFGQYTFYMALISLIGSIGVFGLDKLVVREKTAIDYGTYLAHCLIVGLSVLAMCSILVLPVFDKLIEPGAVSYLFVGAACLSVLRLYSGYFRSNSFFFLSEFAGNVSRLLALVILLFVFLNALDGHTVVLQLVAVASFSAVCLTIFLGTALVSAKSRSELVSAVRYSTGSSFVYLLFTIVASAQAYADVVILRIISTQSEVAEYSVAIRLASFLVFGTVAINVVIGPRIAAAYREGRMDSLSSLTKKAARFGFAFSFGIGVPLAVFAGPVLGMFGAQYVVAAPALQIIVATQMLSAAFGPVNQLCLYAGGAYVSSLAVGLSVVINLLSNVLLVPVLGTTGAALSLFVSFLAWNLILFVYLRSKYRINASVF